MTKVASIINAPEGEYFYMWLCYSVPPTIYVMQPWRKLTIECDLKPNGKATVNGLNANLDFI